MKRKTRAASEDAVEKKSKTVSPEVLKFYGVLAAVKPVPRSLLRRFLVSSGVSEQEADNVPAADHEFLPGDGPTFRNIVYALLDEYETTPVAERASWLPILDCLLPKVTDSPRGSVLYMKGEITKDRAEAKRLFEEALPIFETWKGIRSTDVSRTLHAIAGTCTNRNEAEFLLQRAMAIVGRTSSAEMLPILRSLADLAEKPKVRLDYLEEARRVSMHHCGYTHPETGHVMLQLAKQYEVMDNTEEAIAHYGHAARILRDEKILTNIERLQQRARCMIH